MRRAAKVDANQARIVQALRNVGVRVLHLHQLGNGIPDVLACFRGRNVLLEIKQPGEQINKLQAEFMATWDGEIHVVRSEAEAIGAVLQIRAETAN